MARVTVEDCVDKITNRFDLILVAAQRARKIGSGSPLTVERDNDKNPVVSLREIAAETIDVDQIREDFIKSHQRVLAHEDDEAIDLMEGEKEWADMADKAAAAEGIYSDEVVEEDAGEASLSDIAGA